MQSFGNYDCQLWHHFQNYVGRFASKHKLTRKWKNMPRRPYKQSALTKDYPNLLGLLLFFKPEMFFDV